MPDVVESNQNPNNRPTAPYFRSGVVPRFGMWSGPNYAGGKEWQNNEVPDAKAWLVAPVSFLDAVTKNHDTYYTYIEQKWKEADAKKNPQIAADRNKALWVADREMLFNVLGYIPRNFLEATYRQAMVTAFIAKADREYGRDVDVVSEWNKYLASRDASFGSLTRTESGGVSWNATDIMRSSGTYVSTGMERLSTSGVNVQVAMLFNQHLVGKKIQPMNFGSVDGQTNDDFSARILIPRRDESGNYFVASGRINGAWVEMTYDPVLGTFVRTEKNGSQVLREDHYSPAGTRDEFGQHDYRVATTIRGPGATENTTYSTLPREETPRLYAAPELAQIKGIVYQGPAAKYGPVDQADRNWINGVPAFAAPAGGTAPVTPRSLVLTPVADRLADSDSTEGIEDVSVDPLTGIQHTRTFTRVTDDQGTVVGANVTVTQRDASTNVLLSQYQAFRDAQGLRSESVRVFDSQGRLIQLVESRFDTVESDGRTQHVTLTVRSNYEAQTQALTQRESSRVVNDATGAFIYSETSRHGANGELLGKRVATADAFNLQTIAESGPSGQETSRIRRQIFWDDEGPSYMDEVTDKITGQRYLLATGYDGSTRTAEVPDPDKTAQQLRDSLVTDTTSLIQSLRAHDKAGFLLASAKIATTYALLNGRNAGSLNEALQGISSTLGVLGALRGLRSPNGLTQMNAAVGLLQNANNIAAQLGVNKGAGFLSAQAQSGLSAVGAMLAIANLANLDDMFERGQVGSALMTMSGAIQAAQTLNSLMAGSGVVMMNPYAMAAMVVASIVLDDVFAEDAPPPPPVGQARIVRNADGTLGYEISGAANGGEAILAQHMGALLNKLAEQLAQANAGVTDPAQRLELVAARMPRVLIQSWPGTELTHGVSNYFFVLQYADAQDGEVKYRNGNGVLDDASELFNAVDTPFEQRDIAQGRNQNGDEQLRRWFERDGSVISFGTRVDGQTGLIRLEAEQIAADGVRTSFRRSEITQMNQSAAAQQALRDSLITDTTSLIQSLRARDKAGVLLASAKIATNYALLNGRDAGSLSEALQGISSTLGVLGALHGLRSPNGLTQLNAAVGLLQNANNLAVQLGVNKGAGFLSAQAQSGLGAVGAMLAIANLANLDDMFERGHPRAAHGRAAEQAG